MLPAFTHTLTLYPKAPLYLWPGCFGEQVPLQPIATLEVDPYEIISRQYLVILNNQLDLGNFEKTLYASIFFLFLKHIFLNVLFASRQKHSFKFSLLKFSNSIRKRYKPETILPLVQNFKFCIFGLINDSSVCISTACPRGNFTNSDEFRFKALKCMMHGS